MTNTVAVDLFGRNRTKTSYEYVPAIYCEDKYKHLTDKDSGYYD